jgi:hypothetical protein
MQLPEVNCPKVAAMDARGMEPLAVVDLVDEAQQ